MRIINLGNKEVKIMGSPMTVYYYKKEFGQSFSGDLIAMQEMEEDPSKFDDINVLQMIWAMVKTCDKKIKPFVNWLEDLEFLNIGDIIDDVSEEALNATFRSPKEEGKQQ